jgi:hypothetical protein
MPAWRSIASIPSTVGGDVVQVIDKVGVDVHIHIVPARP